VTLDEAGEHLAELVARGVVGVVTELLDAIGEARVGEHDGDALERAVDAALDRRPPRMAAGVIPSARRSTASRWSSSRAATRASISASVVAARARSCSPNDCRRVFIVFTAPDATGPSHPEGNALVE
jgi:hypothetical protein